MTPFFPEARPSGRAVSRERLGDWYYWDRPIEVRAPLCPPRRTGPYGQSESGGIALAVICSSTRRHTLEPVLLPDRALCLPTFSHFLIVNKTSLSLAFSPLAAMPSKSKYIYAIHHKNSRVAPLSLSRFDQNEQNQVVHAFRYWRALVVVSLNTNAVLLNTNTEMPSRR